jgi:general secretion pathway protein K
MMKSTRGNGGSATILMTLIAAVIVTVGLGFNWLVREHIQASEGLKNKAEAILKARSAFDTVIYLLLNGQFSRKEVILVGGTDITELKTLPLDGQKVSFSEDLSVQIQESNGMLSLSNVNMVALERLIRKETGLDNASGPINSLLDWIDIDDLTRINGAEEFYYKGQGLPYGPRNYALQYKEEVGFIKGFENGLYGKLQPYLTLLPSPGFNPNTASDAVLMAYLDINEESLKTLKEFMSKKAIASDMELFALTGRRLGGEDDFYPSTFMEVTVRAGAPKSIYSIRAGLRVTQNIYSPYSVIYWSEE